MIKSELFSFLIVILLSVSCSQAAPTKSYSSIGNPNGIVFKFVLYIVGLANYVCDTAGGQLIEDVFCNIYFNYKEDLTDCSFSAVVYVDFRGNDILLRSAISSDTSVTNVTNTKGQGAFSDITQVILKDWNGGAAPAINLCGTDYPNGYIYTSKFTTTLLFYHHGTK
ncbi:hypothetical protein C2G38_2123933 [Gigaspora rosea]|uniref:Uncharacterized protein n=1 Tax=Gigaspora rosea TaxID=44941 RepID=A0A397TYK0_9GLOM|nr:hypothetical protein C2G38_2123933 [Gigaspora rosea]